MTDQHSPLRPPTMEDIKAILAHAEDHPAERQKLLDVPEDVLKQAGLNATPNAVECLRSFGQVKFDPSAQVSVPSIEDPLGSRKGEL